VSRINITGSSGAVLATEPKLLDPNTATDSRNAKPGRGDLRPWRTPLGVYTVPSGTKTIYRMGRKVPSDTQYWLTWNTVVHAIHGFISGDTTERTFYTGDGPPKQTNNIIGVAGPGPYPTASRSLGVPAPVSKLAVAPLTPGVADQEEIRYYTYTYVTEWGDESAPAPVSDPMTGKTDATYTLSAIASPPAGDYGINRIRFYRTQYGSNGESEFFFLREEISSITSTTDDGRALGEVLPTDGWLTPPTDLRNLTAMWNGMAAAIVDSDGSVRYCLAYKPYAWPIAQETLTPNAQAVGLGVFGQRLLIVTTGKPVLVAGSSPDSLDEQPLEFAQSCVSSQSVVSMGHGVAWASPEGLAYFGDGGAKLVTAGILTPDQWAAMRPDTIIGALYEGAYFGSYLDADDVRRGFFIDCISPAGIFFLDEGYDAAFYDDSQDVLYVLKGTSIQKWDAGASLMTASRRTKEFVGYERSYTAARVEADVYPVTLIVDAKEVSPALVADRLLERPDLFTSPAAGVLRHTRAVTNREPFRLPGGFTSRIYQFTVQTGVGGLQWAAIATSISELVESE